MRPSHLDSREQDYLMTLELGRSLPDAGRYILAVASKKHAAMSQLQKHQKP